MCLRSRFKRIVESLLEALVPENGYIGLRACRFGRRLKSVVDPDWIVDIFFGMANFVQFFRARFVQLAILGVISSATAVAEVIRDVEYARPEGYSLLLDVYLPERGAEELFPVVVWVHGGGWKNGSKEKSKAAWLAGEGIAVVSINYRLTDVAQWPAQIDD